MTEERDNIKVVGIRYEQDKGLPRVTVKGSGGLAKEIIKERDRLSGPPVIKNEKLLNDLYRLPMDAEIDTELFELVARILVHIFAVEGKMSEKTDG